MLYYYDNDLSVVYAVPKQPQIMKIGESTSSLGMWKVWVTIEVDRVGAEGKPIDNQCEIVEYHVSKDTRDEAIRNYKRNYYPKCLEINSDKYYQLKKN